MKHKVKTVYTRKLIFNSSLNYLIRSMGWSFYGSLGISLSAAIYLLIQGNRTILLPVFLVVSIFGVLIFFRMFSLYFGSANNEFKKLDKGYMWVTFRENGISFNSDHDSLQWKNLHKVWSNDDSYLFFTAKHSFIICPTSGYDADILNFIEDKLFENGISR